MRQGSLIHPLAVFVHRKKRSCALGGKQNEKKRNPAALKTHHQKRSTTETAANSRRLTTKQAARISPSSPVSSDAGFVEIGHIQLSQSMIVRKNTDRQHTTERQTNRPLNIGSLYTSRYVGAFLPIGKNGLTASRELNEARFPDTSLGRVRSQEKKRRVR